MPGRRFPATLFVVIAVAAAAECIHDFPLLPDPMASHFDSSGFPNGWETKPHFFEGYAGVIALAAFVGFLMPLAMAKIPPYLINLPNKEYWLAPERREETFASLGRYFAWYSCTVSLLGVVVMHFAILANIRIPPQLSSGPPLFLVYAFLLSTLVWIISMVRRFSKVR